MIRDDKSSDTLDFILKFFPNYKVSLDPYEKVYAYFDDDIIGFISSSIIRLNWCSDSNNHLYYKK